MEQKRSLNNTYILGVGHYVPHRVLTNADLEQMVSTSDEWIITRTGIRERRIAAEGEACSDLALKAAVSAMKMANISAEDITHIFVATFTPDYCTPTAACILQDKLKATKCEMAMDIAAGCSGFSYGLEVSRGIIAHRPEAKILLVGSEVCSCRVNFRDRNTCVLFGDGAGAAILTGEISGAGKVLDILLRADGSLGHLLPVGKQGGSAAPFKVGQEVSEDYFIQMNGRELFKHAVRGMAEMSLRLLKKNGLSLSEIDLFIPHQANLRIIDAVAKKLELPRERVFINVHRYGNTSAASVIIALSEAYHQGHISRGYRVLMSTFGAGLTWGSILLQF